MSYGHSPSHFSRVRNPVRPLKAMRRRQVVWFSVHSVVSESPLTMFLSYFAASSFVRYALRLGRSVCAEEGYAGATRRSAQAPERHLSNFRWQRTRMNRLLSRRRFLRIATLAAGAPMFDVRLPRGLDFTLQNSPTPQKYLIETMPGGVALFDYNNDGLLDIFLVNGGRVTSPMQLPEKFDRANPHYWNRLYRQNRDGSFTDVTEAAGLSSAGPGNYGMGVAVGDYDNDGYPDLFVTSYGKNILYHNNGDGTFTDVTAKAGVAGGGWSVSAGFFDFDNDGHLDLFVTRYMEWDTRHSKTCGGAWQTYCPPGEFPATTNLLYRNRGDGTFEDVSQKSGIVTKKGRALGVAFADYDDDGFTDIFVANDGKPDIIVTELPREIYGLYHNDGGGSFSNRSLEGGLGALTAGSSGWGAGLEDLDNDGWKDLFVAQGHVLDNVEAIDHSLHYLETPLLALNHGGRFDRAESGITIPVAGRGLAFGDLNNDGWMDAVMTVLGGHPIVLMNRGGDRRWLTISLRGTRSNRDGLGARVRVNGQTRFAPTAGSYLSANDKRLHFGPGDSEIATVDVAWPSGAR